MPESELVVYYFQHYMIFIIAPVILYCSGRYNAKDSFKFPQIMFGFVCFSIYMRYFLTPLSALTWANLNHTLCGVDNDPWRVTFGMHKYFYFWADAYLNFTSHVFASLTMLVAIILQKVFCCGNKKLLKVEWIYKT